MEEREPDELREVGEGRELGAQSVIGEPWEVGAQGIVGGPGAQEEVPCSQDHH